MRHVASSNAPRTAAAGGRTDQHPATAVWFVVTQGALFLWLRPESWGVPLAAVAIVLVMRATSLRLRSAMHATLLIGLGLLFVVVRVRSAWLRVDMSQIHAAFAEYLLLVQAAEFLRPPRRTTANYLPGLGCLTIISLVISFDSVLIEASLLWAHFAFTLVLLAALRPDLPKLLTTRRRDLRRKVAILLLTAASSVACGSLFRQELARDLPALQNYFTRLQAGAARSRFAQTRARFVESVDLNSISEAQRNDPETPVFTVEANHTPGYLRTMALSRFDGWRWQDRGRLSADSVRLPQESVPDWVAKADFGNRLHKLFALHAVDASNPVRCILKVPSNRGKLVPIPQHTTHLVANARRLMLDEHGVIVRGIVNTNEYITYSARDLAVPEQRFYLEELTKMPPQDADKLASISREICSGASTTTEKLRAIESHFVRHFTYSLDSDPASNLGGRSPLVAFLEDRRAAHCEYFATASVLLLRAQGIPSRLCVGYLVYEMNDAEDYFVAANRNAHAWAEAYDQVSNTWRIVESTPGTSETIDRFATRTLADAQTGPGTGSIAESETLLGRLVTLMSRLNAGALRFTWTLPLVLLLSIAGYRRFARRATSRTTDHPGTPQLRRADRIAKRLGYLRAPQETCHQFAQRLASQDGLGPLATWYQEYGMLRYRHPATPIAAPPRPSAPHVPSRVRA